MINNYFIMFVTNFIISMIVMPIIMINSFSHFTFSLGKFYASTIMGLLMILSHIGLSDYVNKTKSINDYCIYGLLLIVYIYLYKYQCFIDDINYLKEMKEHHSMALLTSYSKYKNTSNPKVKAFANLIYKNQNKEINYINKLIKQID